MRLLLELQHFFTMLPSSIVCCSSKFRLNLMQLLLLFLLQSIKIELHLEEGLDEKQQLMRCR
jgi:hypothetical protein